MGVSARIAVAMLALSCAGTAPPEVRPGAGPARAAAADLPPMPAGAAWPDFEVLADRLSLDLRVHRMSLAERATLRRRGGSGEPLRAIYGSLVSAWLDRDFFRDLIIGAYIRYPEVGSLMVGALERAPLPGGGWLYYLPHTLTAPVAPGQPPCPEADRVRVRPWWRVGETILVCKGSYRPDHLFDEVGYCAGQPEPTVRVPPRPGCGCGPLMTSCLPPVVEQPRLRAELERDVLAEVTETGTHILREQRFDALLTATTTWQTGLVQLLYLRRELVEEVHDHGWSPEIEERYAGRIAAIDVRGPGRWVRRGGAYAGTGLSFTTIASQATYSTYRVMMLVALGNYMCTTFRSIRVDSHSLLTAVGDNPNVRAFAVHESPMRSLVGCKGCHAPLDNAAGFMRELTTPLFGFHPTGLPAHGSLYVKGAEDYRGEGSGFAGLAALLTRQPEFGSCATWRLIGRFIGPETVVGDPAYTARMQEVFEHSGRNVEATIRAILDSDRYTAPVVLDGPTSQPRAACAAAPDLRTVTAAAGAILEAHCAGCHDADHRIDLSVPPETIRADTWAKISQAVENGMMPPPSNADVDKVGDLGRRFTLDPEKRRILTQTAVRVAAAGAPQEVAARRSPSFPARLRVLRAFGGQVLPAAEVERVMSEAGLSELRWIESSGLLSVDLKLATYGICHAVIEHGGWSDAGGGEALVDALFTTMLGRPPLADERRRARAELERWRARPGTTAAQAATAFCTAQLTDPGTNDLIFSAAAARASRCE